MKCIDCEKWVLPWLARCKKHKDNMNVRMQQAFLYMAILLGSLLIFLFIVLPKD